MMFIIVRKGSVFYGKLVLRDEECADVELSEGDRIIFTVRKKLSGGTPVIRKVLYPGEEIGGAYPFMLDGEETDIAPGTYYYDAALECQNGEFYHLTDADEFIVCETVSEKEEEENEQL